MCCFALGYLGRLQKWQNPKAMLILILLLFSLFLLPRSIPSGASVLRVSFYEAKIERIRIRRSFSASTRLSERLRFIVVGSVNQPMTTQKFAKLAKFAVLYVQYSIELMEIPNASCILPKFHSSRFPQWDTRFLAFVSVCDDVIEFLLFLIHA